MHRPKLVHLICMVQQGLGFWAVWGLRKVMIMILIVMTIFITINRNIIVTIILIITFLVFMKKITSTVVTIIVIMGFKKV